MAHTVFFTLHDASPEARDRLVSACRRYLADHPGVRFFAAGVRGDAFDRDVNDREFDVSLHLVFDDVPSHDAYQSAPDHATFIEENHENWKAVRVFDTMLGND